MYIVYDKSMNISIVHFRKEYENINKQRAKYFLFFQLMLRIANFPRLNLALRCSLCLFLKEINYNGKNKDPPLLTFGETRILPIPNASAISSRAGLQQIPAQREHASIPFLTLALGGGQGLAPVLLTSWAGQLIGSLESCPDIITAQIV